MKRAILGIGTNIGDREKNIRGAVEALKHLPCTEIVNVSNIYETEPWGFLDQPNFYNVCAEISTNLSPNCLLGACLGIEAAFGRERPFKNSPRILDIDLLLYQGTEITTAELTVPHPLIGERAFVLAPLHDLLPDMKFDKFDFEKDYLACDLDSVNKIV